MCEETTDMAVLGHFLENTSVFKKQNG